MSPMHANPFDSVNIFKDTKCKRAMGIHWGTWLDFPSPIFLCSSRSGAPRQSLNAPPKRKNADLEKYNRVLTEEDVLEPPQLLKKALTRSGLPDTGVFDVCEIGETREF